MELFLKALNFGARLLIGFGVISRSIGGCGGFSGDKRSGADPALSHCGKIEKKLGSGYSKNFQLTVSISKLDFRDLKLKID